MFVSRPLAGRITDKFGASFVIYPSALCMAISFIMLWSAKDISIVYLSAVFAALGYGAAYPAFQTNCLQSVPAIKRGVASNTSYFGIDLGGFLGPTYGGFVIAAFLNTGRAYSIMYLSGLVPVILAVITLTLTKGYIKKNIELASSADN
jgi:MFS family permease